jgi:hypothetical protein
VRVDSCVGAAAGRLCFGSKIERLSWVGPGAQSELRLRLNPPASYPVETILDRSTGRHEERMTGFWVDPFPGTSRGGSGSRSRRLRQSRDSTGLFGACERTSVECRLSSILSESFCTMLAPRGRSSVRSFCDRVDGIDVESDRGLHQSIPRLRPLLCRADDSPVPSNLPARLRAFPQTAGS